MCSNSLMSERCLTCCLSIMRNSLLVRRSTCCSPPCAQAHYTALTALTVGCLTTTALFHMCISGTNRPAFDFDFTEVFCDVSHKILRNAFFKYPLFTFFLAFINCSTYGVKPILFYNPFSHVIDY